MHHACLLDVFHSAWMVSSHFICKHGLQILGRQGTPVLYLCQHEVDKARQNFTTVWFLVGLFSQLYTGARLVNKTLQAVGQVHLGIFKRFGTLSLLPPPPAQTPLGTPARAAVSSLSPATWMQPHSFFQSSVPNGQTPVILSRAGAVAALVAASSIWFDAEPLWTLLFQLYSCLRNIFFKICTRFEANIFQTGIKKFGNIIWSVALHDNNIWLNGKWSKVRKIWFEVSATQRQNKTRWLG